MTFLQITTKSDLAAESLCGSFSQDKEGQAYSASMFVLNIV